MAFAMFTSAGLVAAALTLFVQVSFSVTDQSSADLSSQCGINLHHNEMPRRALNQTVNTPSQTRKTKAETQFSTANREDFRAQFTAADFTFDLLKFFQAARAGAAGKSAALTVDDMPAFYGEGVAMAMVELQPCAVNLPHVHPRATELLYAIHAEALEVGVLDSRAGSRYVINRLKTGQLSFFPQGLLHYQVNRGCTNVSYVAFFNSEDAGGVWYAPWALFDLPTDLVASSLDVDQKLVAAIHQGQPSSTPAIGSEECLKRCGIATSNYLVNRNGDSL